MKKLITAAVASAFAFLAMGAANAVNLPSGTSFEDLSTGEKNFSDLVDYDDSGTDQGSLFWFTTVTPGTDAYTNNPIATVKQYLDGETPISAIDIPVTNRPAQWAGKPNGKYLAVDTSNDLLYRTIGPKAATLDGLDKVEIGDGIYLDTLVQFTAADKAFEAGDIAAGDKIAISYVERDADSVDEGEDPYTNFVVRAGYVVGSSIVATNYFLTFPGDSANEVKFDKTAWHRLTVRAISDVGNATAPVGFVVYVDGTNLVYNASVSGGSTAPGDQAYVDSLNSVVSTYIYNDDTHALLPSVLSSSDDNYNTLAAVGFKGNGSVDDISFTADKPGILPVEGMTVTIAWDANVTNCTVVAGETILINEAVSGAGSTNLLLAAEVTAITVTAGYAEGYEAGAWTASAGTLSNGEWTDLEGGATLTINSMLPLFDVGGVHYGSFEDALAAATAGGAYATIKLLADYTGDIAFDTENTASIIIDLAGKTLTGDSDAAIHTGCASIIITNSTVEVGHVVAPEGGFAVVLEEDAVLAVYAGIYDGEIADDSGETAALTIYGGSFYDAAYVDDPTNDFYLKSFVAEGLTISEPVSGYFTVSGAEPPAPTTYALTLPTGVNATATVKAGGVVVADISAIDAGTEVVVEWTADSDYKITAGATENITMDSNKTAAPPTVVAITYATLTITQVDNCSIVVSNATEEVASGTKFDADDEVELTVYRTPAEGYELNGYNATETITMDQDRTVTAAVKQSGGYPSYIPEDAAVKAKYDIWAETYGADTGSAYETAFLLNIAPNAADQTLEPASITMEGGKVVISANQTLTAVNGKVYVKVATTLAGLATAEWTEATLDEGKVQVTPGSSDTAGFYKIKVDF